MVYRISLRNFGPHKEFNADLIPGPNMFLGPNGSGKSNIVYAIGWAVLGPRSLPGAYSQRDIIRDGESEVSVEVDLDFIGKRLVFFRSYDGKNTVAKVTDTSGEILASGSTGVSEFLTHHGFDWDAASIPFCRQRDLDAFVLETPANRKRIIASLLQLESVDASVKWVRSQMGLLEPPPEYCDIDKLNLLLKAAKDDYQCAVQTLKSIEQEVTISKFNLSQELLKLPTDTGYEQRDNLLKMLANSKSELAIHERARDANAWALTEDFGQGHDPIAVEEGIQLLRERSDKIELGMKSLEQAAIAAESKNKALVELSDMITDECPVCKTRFTVEEAQRIAEQFQSTLEELPENVELVEANKSYEAVNNLLTKAKALREENCIIEERNGRILKAIDIHEAAKAKVDDWKGRIKKQRDELEALPKPPPRSVLDAIQVLQSIVNDKERKVIEWEMERAKTSDTIREREADIEESKKLKVEAKKLKKVFDDHKLTVRALTSFRNQLLSSALTWVSARATQVLQSSGDIAVAPAGSRLELDDNLVYSIVQSDGTVQPVYRVSGGQAAVFSTCLRIALSEYLTDRMGMNGLLLLDAIFEPMNEENRSIVAEAIKSYGPPQTLLFSYFDVPELKANVISV